MSFGSFLKLITIIIDAHSRKFLITHYASLFEYLLIFSEYKKKKKPLRISSLIRMAIIRIALVLKAVLQLNRCYRPYFPSFCWNTLIQVTSFLSKNFLNLKST